MKNYVRYDDYLGSSSYRLDTIKQGNKSYFPRKLKKDMGKNNKTPVSDWLKAKEFRNNRVWQLTPDGVMRTMVEGKWLTAREFDKQFPVPKKIHFYSADQNPDGTKSFLHED